MRFLNRNLSNIGRNTQTDYSRYSPSSNPTPPPKGEEFFGQQKPLDERDTPTIYGNGYFVPIPVAFIPTDLKFDDIPGESSKIGNIEYKVYNNPDNGQKEVYCKSADENADLFTPPYIINGEHYNLDENDKLAKVFTGTWPADQNQSGVTHNGSTYKVINGEVYQNKDGKITLYQPAENGSYVIGEKTYVLDSGKLAETLTDQQFNVADDTGVSFGGKTYKAINGQVYASDGNVVTPVPFDSDNTILIGNNKYQIDPEAKVLVRTAAINDPTLFDKWNNSPDLGVTLDVGGQKVQYKAVIIDDKGTVKVFQKTVGSPDVSDSVTEILPNKNTGTYIINGEHYRIQGKGTDAKLVKVPPKEAKKLELEILAGGGLRVEGDDQSETTTAGLANGEIHIATDLVEAEAAISATSDGDIVVDLRELVFNLGNKDAVLSGKVGFFDPKKMILPDAWPHLLVPPRSENPALAAQGNLKLSPEIGLTLFGTMPDILNDLNKYTVGGGFLLNPKLFENVDINASLLYEYTGTLPLASNNEDQTRSATNQHTVKADVATVIRLNEYWHLLAGLQALWSRSTVNAPSGFGTKDNLGKPLYDKSNPVTIWVGEPGSEIETELCIPKWKEGSSIQTMDYTPHDGQTIQVNKPAFYWNPVTNTKTDIPIIKWKDPDKKESPLYKEPPDAHRIYAGHPLYDYMRQYNSASDVEDDGTPYAYEPEYEPAYEQDYEKSIDPSVINYAETFTNSLVTGLATGIAAIGLPIGDNGLTLDLGALASYRFRLDEFAPNLADSDSGNIIGGYTKYNHEVAVKLFADINLPNEILGMKMSPYAQVRFAQNLFKSLDITGSGQQLDLTLGFKATR
jgi:hypothetical protein